MQIFGKRVIGLFAIVLLTGCAMQRYTPSPIVPATTASQFESRTLANADFRSFVERTLGHSISPWPPKRWDLQTLSVAALYFNPALGLPQARVATARGAILTAKARPNPTFDLTPGIPSPYLLTQDFLLMIETAGKRMARVEAAQNLDEAAQLDLADSAWTVVMGVRQALLTYLMAERNLELLKSEEKVREDQVAILEKILAAGELTTLNVDPARLDLSKTEVGIRAAETHAADARAALASAIGVPGAAIEGLAFSWPELDKPPQPGALSIEKVRRDAVVNRLDIRRSLAQYAAAEADLRSEIAKQYPNFNIGPGYTFEEQKSFFTVGFSTSLPVFNHNQGPIAEAEGRRKEAAATFLQTQAQVIQKSERALTAYKAALKEVAASQSLYDLQEQQLRAVERTVRAGADNRLSVDGVQIQLAVLARARLDALGRAQRALGDLEDAVQRPLASGEAFPSGSEIRKLDRFSGDQRRDSPSGTSAKEH